MARKHTFPFLLIVCFILGCNRANKHTKLPHIQKKERTPIASKQAFPLLSRDTTITLLFNNEHKIKTTLRFPNQSIFKGTIITLPGWNFSRNQWCDSTSFCQKALQEGYIIVQPEMGKSIYCERFYPETRTDWRKYPTRKWIKDSLISELQTYHILHSTHSNFILGLSTGARGAALLARDLPHIFKGCAVLSGDYDQTKFPMDNLYRGFYGEFKNFPDRWLEDDNLITHITDLKVPIYIGHGSNDNVVSIEHSRLLKQALDSSHNSKYEFHIDSLSTHNYSYWNSEIDNILEYFSKITSSSLTSD
ncbi:MAG: prolyl oligopeptidase family serine peptidase [Crocinitomicaceae bacterium]|nr:prolyl oligopeptidase family serine peptidase [Crocinitomicaceae bacterium]